ncbi:hypothetical protein BP00DRAFT_392542 [Aspergillus indologenus CBS 114.80]|uniref:Major facilitator superfamily (MFS) profile domain-containing protein n=1 Tax=Aspergillus indologenus CBS 114.80 TaxID=1450541 RepID=A0A2V5IX90_9EURO|nr:hypothetical protein BP00DRAFT_392542 [Aspergillus indologenus CBS 114.80]
MWRWRDPLVIVCAAILITALPWLALESPHQSITRGHITTAFQTLRKTRPSAIVAARDLYRVYVSSPRRSSSLTPAARRAIISSTAIMLTRVLIAPQPLNMYINIRTRSEASRLELDSLSMAVSLSFIMLLGNSTIDANRYGRRRGLTLGLAILPIFSVPFFETLDIAINYTLSLFHFASGSFSDIWAAICTVYAVEVLPSHCRGITAGFVSHHASCFYRLAAMCSFPVTLVLVIFAMRETRKVPLEDMGHLLEARNRDLALYQKVVLEPFEESRYGGGAIALE